MTRLALAWELGEASGYAALMTRIARAARDAGHECIAIVRDLHVATPIFDAGGLDLALLQAPVATATRAPHVRVQTSYATLLHNCGFGDPVALAARLRAWQTLYRSFGIDRVLVRHSPTALLAARLSGLPVLHYGHGFSIPPAATPWPSFRPDTTISDEILVRNEAQVLTATNRALHLLGAAPLAQLADLFADVPTCMTSCHELDHYARLAPPAAIGLPDLSYGAAPVWPAADGVRLFASLLPAPGAAAWLQQLAALPLCALVRLARVATVTQAPANLRIVHDALDFGQAISAAAAVFGYASHNLVYEALMRGRPLVLLAYAPDQLMLARRVEALGLGVLLPGQPDATATDRLRAVIEDPAYARRAAAFAARHATVPP
jgi:UDP:flavonoid glycosyltransferase YjiC (YdhE family)